MHHMFVQCLSDGKCIFTAWRLLPFRAAAKDTEEEYDSGIEEENWTRQADAAKN